MTAETDLLHCAECGMPCEPGEYHPFAACLMFKASRNSTVVRANLRSVQRHATAARDAEIKALRAEVDEWKDVARCASEQQDSLFREARALSARADNLRAEVERANGWNERVSVCRDHVADIVDGPCVICALDAAEARADKLAEALRLIASPQRPDGSWNRDREACRQIAAEVLRDHDQEGK